MIVSFSKLPKNQLKCSFDFYLIAAESLGASLQLELGRSGLSLDREAVVQAEDPGHLVAPEARPKPAEARNKNLSGHFSKSTRPLPAL